MMRNKKEIITYLLIITISSLLFVPFLGGVHLFDWDEINFAESAREMIVTGDYLTVRINYQPFWEKPPLFIWMQALSMKAFGINEFAARFPNAVCGIISLLLIYYIGRKHFDKKFGLIWILCFAGSILPFIYFKSGIIDPWFNLFIFSAVYFFIRYKEANKDSNIYMSSALIGLAILTKGPVAFLIYSIAILIYLVINKFQLKFTLRNLAVSAIILALTGGFWFILQILNGNFTIIKDFIIYQIRLFKTEDAGHGGFLFYHFVVLFIGVFPASVFAIKNLFSFKRFEGENIDLKQMMIILFWVVLILFTIVKTKIVHYSSLCYFPLTFLAAFTIYNFLKKPTALRKWMKILVITLGAIYIILLISIPFFLMHYEKFLPYIKDEFAKGNLAADVKWTGIEGAVSLFLVFGMTLFLIYTYKNYIFKAVMWLFVSNALFIYFVMIVYVPRVEKYSQNAAIEFFKSLKNEDVYLSTIGYKSYAHYFYGNIQPYNNTLATDQNWLLTGKIDKNAFFSSKITKKQEILSSYPDIKLLYEKNGFVFWQRLAQQD